MTGEGYCGDGSPDRADALVWALSELMVKAQAPVAVFGTYGSGRIILSDPPARSRFQDGLITDPTDPLFGGNASTMFRF
jgi:hypothetical protein